MTVSLPNDLPEPLRDALEDRTLYVSDAARRASDIINEFRANTAWEELAHKWIAIRLSDGGSDRVLYDHKKDAVRFQLHEQQCAYISFLNLIGGARPEEMEKVLAFHRHMYDAGMRLIDPEDVHGGLDLIPTAQRHDDFVHRIFPGINRRDRREAKRNARRSR